MTYKVTMFGYEPHSDPKMKGVKVRTYLTIKTGLTWQEAKDLRKVNRALMIVPEVDNG